jgi:hypothetical protein
MDTQLIQVETIHPASFSSILLMMYILLYLLFINESPF